MIFPVAHAAVPEFYDRTLVELSHLRKSCGNFSVVVEGASVDRAERQMETDEMQLIVDHVRNFRQAVAELNIRHRGGSNNSSRGEQIEDFVGESAAVQESAAFVFKLKNATERGLLYSERTVREICDMYRLPFPMPERLVLQDTYFKPRMALTHGDCVVNGDIVLSEQPRQLDMTADAVQFHAAREMSCVSKVIEILEQRNDAGGYPSKTVVVLWGHFHCPRILSMLAMKKSSLAQQPPLFSSAVIPYGWSRELVQQIYGVEM